MSEELSLPDTFATIRYRDEHVRDSLDRRNDNPNSAARVVKVNYGVSVQHHERYEKQYDDFTWQVSDNLFLETANSFRHPITGRLTMTEKNKVQEQK